MLSTLRYQPIPAKRKKHNPRIREASLIRSYRPHPKIRNFGYKEYKPVQGVFIIGLAVIFRDGVEIYVFSYMKGDEMHYAVKTLKLNGCRQELCKSQIFRILDKGHQSESTTRVFIYRDTDFDIHEPDELAAEYYGMQMGILKYCSVRSIQQLRHVFVTVSEGHHNWGDFILPGSMGFPNTSYIVVGPSSDWNIEDVMELSWALSYSTGYVRMCWKAKHYLHLQRMRRMFGRLLVQFEGFDEPMADIRRVLNLIHNSIYMK